LANVANPQFLRLAICLDTISTCSFSSIQQADQYGIAIPQVAIMPEAQAAAAAAAPPAEGKSVSEPKKRPSDV